MELVKLLSSTSVGYYNKYIARNIGLDEAILLSELCSKYEYWKRYNQLTEDGYFYETQEDIEENTILSPYKQRCAIKTLADLGILEFKVIGMPATKYFKIDESKLLNILQLDVKKLNLSNNINNNTNTFNNNNISKDISLSCKSRTLEKVPHKKQELFLDKPKKKTIYQQCIDYNKTYTNNEDLLTALDNYLRMRINKVISGKKIGLTMHQWELLLSQLSQLKNTDLDKIRYLEYVTAKELCTFKYDLERKLKEDEEHFKKFGQDPNRLDINNINKNREEYKKSENEGTLVSF